MLKLETYNKYKNKRCVIDGYSFPSQVEGKHYADLRLREKARYISNLQVQFKIPLHSRNVHTGEDIFVGNYIADFVYFDNQKFETIIDDVKGGDSTDLFKLKKKMVEAEYGYKVNEIRFGKKKAKRLKKIPAAYKLKRLG